MEENDETPKAPEEGEEFVIEPGAVQSDATEKQDPVADETANQGENAPAAEEAKTETEKEIPNREEIEQIFALGKKIHEYQKAHPGFDPFLLERDYRIKTARLAELERQGVTQVASPEKKIEEVDLSDINLEDQKRLDKYLRAKGFVSKAELEERERARFAQEYEAVKAQEVNSFIAKHPEYHPNHPDGNRNWEMLVGEYSLYKVPNDARKIATLLERAHREVAGKRSSIDPKDAARVLAQNKVNKTGTVANGAPAGGSAPKKKIGVPDEARTFFRGFSDDELSDLYSKS